MAITHHQQGPAEAPSPRAPRPTIVPLVASRHARRGLLAAALLCTGTSALPAQALEWRRLAPAVVPYGRMVFDIARARFVACGTDLLEWSGGDWHYRSTPTAPPPRQNFALAYDLRRARTVLFGGYAAPLYLRDVWEYDGVDWVDRTTASGPSARSFAAAAWCQTTVSILVFGGNNGGRLGDTWTWDGTRWNAIAVPGPSARSMAEMAYHPPTSRMVLFGGATFAGLTSDTWTFDGSTWQLEQPTTVPPARASHRLTSDPANGVVRMFGGGDSVMWAWNGTDWISGFAGPDERNDAAMATDENGATMVLGGRRFLPIPGSFFSNSRDLGDTWAFDGTNGWSRAADAGPPDALVLTALDIARQRVVFASSPTDSLLSTPMREWDGAQWHTIGGPQPPYALYSTMAYDVARARTIRFGGMRASGLSLQLLDEQFDWDGATWSQFTGPRPPARWRHAMAYDIGRSVLVLHGGIANAATSSARIEVNDTWEWDGTQWSQRTVTTPPPLRSAHAMTYDSAHGVTVMFGGSSNGQLVTDTWTWDGVNWIARATTTAPPPRQSAQFLFDFARQRAVLLGGLAPSGYLLDRWEWDGAAWSTDGTTLPHGAASTVSTAVLGEQTIVAANTGIWIGSPIVARADGTGSGCGSGTALALTALDKPSTTRSELVVDLDRGQPLQPALLGIAVGRISVPLGGGCTLYLPGLDATVIAVTGAFGHAEYRLPVPTSPHLLGVEGSLQAAMIDAGAPLGIALTNGLLVRIGV